MYKYVTCPQCGQKLCKGEEGSTVIVTCSKCKKDYKVIVDKDGSTHALPVEDEKRTA